MYGILGDHPPTEPQAFEDLAASLVVPDVADALRTAEPLSGPVLFTIPTTVRPFPSPAYA